MRTNSLFIQLDPFREFESLFRQAFAPVEQVDTDNTSDAPTLLAPTYLAGGTFWRRVAAQDGDRNIGDFSPGQQFSLAKQAGGTAALVRLKLATKLVRATNGRRVTVTVRAGLAAGATAVSGALSPQAASASATSTVDHPK